MSSSLEGERLKLEIASDFEAWGRVRKLVGFMVRDVPDFRIGDLYYLAAVGCLATCMEVPKRTEDFSTMFEAVKCAVKRAEKRLEFAMEVLCDAGLNVEGEDVSVYDAVSALADGREAE